MDRKNALNRPIRWGMVGGGPGSNIGQMHRTAALRDRAFELVAGVFSSNPEKGRAFGVELGVDADRCYDGYRSMFEAEKGKEGGIEAVTIATPNGTHYEIGKAALEAGIHVVCEKPLCFTSEEADELISLSEKGNLVFGVTYGYTGHPLIRQARQMVERGDLGTLRVIDMQFAHGSFNQPVERENPAARWRLDPKSSGPSFILGDVGTHILFMAQSMVPDLEIKELLCVKHSFVEGRELEDDAHVFLNFTNGAFGSLWASGINSGSRHGQVIRVVGSKASLEWRDDEPNFLRYEVEGEPVRIFDRGAAYLYPESLDEDRIGCGHAEGLFEAWANLYRRFSLAMGEVLAGGSSVPRDFCYPDVKDGARGVRFIEACLESASSGSKWVRYKG